MCSSDLTSHERDDEVFSDALDYMLARNYDPLIGRMNQIDPMAHVYSGISPYVYALNTPTNAIDPDGRLVIFVNGFPFDGYIGRQYWNNAGNGFFADQIMSHFPGEQDRYLDGSRVTGRSGETVSIYQNSFLKRLESFRIGSGPEGIGGNMLATSRIHTGERDGEKLAPEIAKLINSKEGETLKVFTHSMGAAYARGLIKALLVYMAKNPDQAFQIEFILDIAPHNAYLIPDSYDFGISSFQSNGKGDGFAHGWVPGSVGISGGSGHGLGGFDPLTLISDIYEWFEKHDRKSTVIIPGLPNVTITIYD